MVYVTIVLIGGVSSGLGEGILPSSTNCPIIFEHGNDGYAINGASAPLPWVRSPEERDVTARVRERLKYNGMGQCTNAFTVLSSVWTLRTAYESIKSNPGNMARGTVRETLDGISEK